MIASGMFGMYAATRSPRPHAEPDEPRPRARRPHATGTRGSMPTTSRVCGPVVDGDRQTLRRPYLGGRPRRSSDVAPGEPLRPRHLARRERRTVRPRPDVEVVPDRRPEPVEVVDRPRPQVGVAVEHVPAFARRASRGTRRRGSSHAHPRPATRAARRDRRSTVHDAARRRSVLAGRAVEDGRAALADGEPARIADRLELDAAQRADHDRPRPPPARSRTCAVMRLVVGTAGVGLAEFRVGAGFGHGSAGGNGDPHPAPRSGHRNGLARGRCRAGGSLAGGEGLVVELVGRARATTTSNSMPSGSFAYRALGGAVVAGADQRAGSASTACAAARARRACRPPTRGGTGRRSTAPGAATGRRRRRSRTGRGRGRWCEPGAWRKAAPRKPSGVIARRPEAEHVRVEVHAARRRRGRRGRRGSSA